MKQSVETAPQSTPLTGTAMKVTQIVAICSISRGVTVSNVMLCTVDVFVDFTFYRIFIIYTHECDTVTLQ